MKICAIFAAMPNYDFKLSRVLKIMTETLAELEVSVETLYIAYEQLSFYDGVKSKAMSRLVGSIMSADGVIFLTTAAMGGPNALMQCFIDYLSFPGYNRLLKNKCCMVAVNSQDGSEGPVCDYLAHIVGRLRGFDAGRIAIGGVYLGSFDTDEELRGIIERQTEDFYRSVRQNRIMFIPSFGVKTAEPRVIKKPKRNPPSVEATEKSTQDTMLIEEIQEDNEKEPRGDFETAGILEDLYERGYLSDTDESGKPFENTDMDELSEKPEIYDTKPVISILKPAMSEAVSKSLPLLDQPLSSRMSDEELKALFDFSGLDDNDEDQINEISESLAMKMSGESVKAPACEKPSVNAPSCKSMTMSLAHYFQPQNSGGTNAVFQIMVNGDEAFNVQLKISGAVCELTEENPESADMVIISDSKAWMNVLKGKISCQKAFMVGQIKVRGNFMLLGKLDQMFAFNMS